MSKRARTTATTSRRAKRPIDKKLVNVQLNTLDSTQQEVDIYPSANFPGTITGLRWTLMVQRTAGAAAFGQYAWAIIVVPAGTNASQLSLTSGSSMYDPEQMVLAFGRGLSGDALEEPVMFEGSTKSMRKLKAGDKLVFIAKGVATNVHFVAGAIQFFYKT